MTLPTPSAPLSQDAATSAAPYTVWQLILYMLGLGTWGFGGPVALVGYMYRNLVERRNGSQRQITKKVSRSLS